MRPIAYASAQTTSSAKAGPGGASPAPVAVFGRFDETTAKMTINTAVLLSDLTLRLTAEDSAFVADHCSRELGEGLYEVDLAFSADHPTTLPLITLDLTIPIIDIASIWTTGVDYKRGLVPDWTGNSGITSRVTNQAPVLGLYSLHGQNRLTIAASDALNAVQLRAGVVEETASMAVQVRLCSEPMPPTRRYALTLRIDRRDLPFHRSLADVAAWWSAQPDKVPMPVPDLARRPMYSTWYSYHQALDPDAIVRECELARDLGCAAVIIDDGWQTMDTERGYAYTGDWEPERIGDMRRWIDRIHETGMKALLWYAVPFVGYHSRMWPRFKSMLMADRQRSKAGVLDPRFPEVREYLVQTYERALREWDVDGLKLDFVDNFRPTDEAVAMTGGGRDIEAVAEAADRLMSDIANRLQLIRPDVMIEFRQSYIGPLMRKYGNIFRAGDCPNDLLYNRMRTIDLRLLSQGTAVHADMLMWHPRDHIESAALQLLHVLFSVPQISVRLAEISEEMRSMLRFWLGFWNEHRDLLLDGHLEPGVPHAIFPTVRSSTPAKRIIAVYEDAVAVVGDSPPPTLLIVNGTRLSRVVLNCDEAVGPRRLRTYNCLGKTISDSQIDLTQGAHLIPIPPAGLAQIDQS